MQRLGITRNLSIPLNEILMTAVPSQGPGGQNVNKVATAIQLRFDVGSSSLPEEVRQRLLRVSDRRITGEGVVVLKAQRFRSQEKNREDALQRLRELISRCLTTARPRKATKPSRTATAKRLDSKSRRSLTKSLRGKVLD